MKRIFAYLKPYRLLAILSPILMMSEVLADLMLPKLMTVIVDCGRVTRFFLISGSSSLSGIR